MKRQTNSLEKIGFELTIVGGGIIGTGIARDAALRGIRTLLIEKEDFGYGTTSRSSRLIHGGLRYLKLMEFHLVRQDLHEREILLNIAPHLVKPYPFIIPMNSLYYNIALRAGVPLYDLLSYDKSIPARQYLSTKKAIDLEPQLANLKGMTGAYIYYDCQSPYTERLAIENVISATENGATIINHAQLIDFIRNGNDICGIKARDNISGEIYEIKSKLVINATGHWVDCIRDLLYACPPSVVRRTKGIHLVTKKLGENALVLFTVKDNRLFFIMPWLDYTLIGSTDTDYDDDLDNVAASLTEVDYLIEASRQVYPELDMDDVYYTTAGIRPLAHIGGEKPSQVTREHKLIDHEIREGIGGIITVLGGKITAYRAVAEDTVDMVCRKMRIKARCITAETPLPGYPKVSQQLIDQKSVEYKLDTVIVSHLAELYGSRFTRVLELVNHNDSEPVCPHCNDIMAQVEYSVMHESTLSVSDFLLRRSLSGVAHCQGLDAVDKVANEMGRLLNWSDAETKRQIEEYREQIDLTQYFRKA